MGGATQSVHENYKSFKRTNLTVVNRKNASVYYVCPISRTTSEERVKCSKGWVASEGGRGFFTAFGRIDVGACYTRGARSRRCSGGGEGEGV